MGNACRLLYKIKLLFIMSFRQRNHSLKALNQPKIQRQQLQEHQEQLKLPKVLPTIAENRQLQKMYTKQLGMNINKLESLSKKVEPQLNPQQLLRTIYFILRNFSEVENNFKNVFVLLQLKIKDFLFIVDSNLCQRYKIRQGMSYKKAANLIDKQHVALFQRTSEQIKLLEQDLFKMQVKLNNEGQNYKIQIANLKDEMSKYKKISDVQYVRSLEKRIENLKETISNQQDQYKVLTKKNQLISVQMQGLRDKLLEQESINTVLTQNIYDLNVLKDKTQIYLLNTRDRFDQLHNKMEGLKDIIQTVERQNENLKTERLKLVNRAASSFDDLTPRPKYSDYILLDNNTHLNPTNLIMKNIMGNYPGQKTQLIQKYFISKKHRKLMQCEAIRQHTVHQINQAQKDLNKIL